MAVPARTTPRQAGAGRRLRHAESGFGRRLDLRRRVDLQRRHGPLRLQADRQEGNDRAVQRLQAGLPHGGRRRHQAEPHQSGPGALGAAPGVGGRATLKPGKRHIYSKRVFYVDEDSWVALASDEYDGRGQMYRSSFDHMTFSYDVQAVQSGNHMIYDFVSGSYNISGLSGHLGGVKYIGPMKPTDWAADALAGAGVR